jgi:membrane protease YdiL (CAAX protease family)
MDPEQRGPFQERDELKSLEKPGEVLAPAEAAAAPIVAPATKDIRWVFMGPHGFRAGWSVLVFILLLVVFVGAFVYLDTLLFGRLIHLRTSASTIDPIASTLEKLAEVLGLLSAAVVMARIERRRLTDYYLRGPHPFANFLGGLCAGFAALSVLVGALTLGGWMHFGPVALSGSRILLYAAVWGVGFLLVACSEEGMFRCYLQYTLTRGINFWWALGVIALLCVDLLLRAKGNGAWGVYLIAGLGLPPCLWLSLSKTPRCGFWQAAWLTSTLFGFVHTGNNGENWIGIFAAGGIGFVFCVSVYVTGSAWWAIGCHASWDWAETYFYGTADSGLVARGHLLTAIPNGNPLWSGGTDGPEGSVLVLGVILLLLVAVLALYGRRRETGLARAAAQQAAG